MAQDWLLDEMPSLADLDHLPVGANDVVIHAPGFEKRTLSLVDFLVPTVGSSAILLDYRPFNPNNRLAQVRSGLNAKGIETSESGVVVYDRFDPTEYTGVLRQRLIERTARRAVVDVSTMSKLAVILTLKVCF